MPRQDPRLWSTHATVYEQRRTHFILLVALIIAVAIALLLAVIVPSAFQTSLQQGNQTPYTGTEFAGPISTSTSDPPHSGPVATIPVTPSLDQGITSNGSTLTFTIHFSTNSPRFIQWTIYSQSGSVVYRAQWSSQSRDVSATFQTGLVRGSYSLTTSVNGKIVRTDALFEIA